ncbi:MAG TPA: ComF family protein [Ktedonobacteraceae bacterium]|nr:ComF family protein [Ktedonobacteraceae bacterium]
MNTPLLLQKSQRFTRQCLDLLFPPRCAGCQKTGSVLCPACLTAIPLLAAPFCQHCGSPSAANGACRSCQYHPPRLHGLRAASLFQGQLRFYIHQLKYEGKTRLAEPLGFLMAQAYRRYGFQVDAIVPVPLHPERQRQRGYNHAALLAEVCALQVGVPLYSDMLQRSLATPAQVGSTASQRYQNVAGAFLCAPAFATGALTGRSILILDDVCTTGATLEACAAPLYAAGATAVWGLVLARPG